MLLKLSKISDKLRQGLQLVDNPDIAQEPQVVDNLFNMLAINACHCISRHTIQCMHITWLWLSEMHLIYGYMRFFPLSSLAGCSLKPWGLLRWIWWCSLFTKALAQEDLSSWINRKYQISLSGRTSCHALWERVWFDKKLQKLAGLTQLEFRNERTNCVSLPAVAYE